jgi:tetratricopeptide (TPR) repeat protein
MYARLTQYLGQPTKAAAIAGEALAAKKPAPTSEYQRQESQYLTNGSYLILAENSEDLGQPEKALTYFSRAHDNIDTMRAAGRIGLDSEFMDSTTLAGMARQLSKLERYGPAITRFRQSIDLQNSILANGPNDQVTRNLIYTSAGLSNTLAKAGRYPEARRLIGQAIEATEAAVRRHPGDGSQQRILALYLTAAAKIERQAGDRPAECAAGARALRQWQVVEGAQAAMPIDTAAGGPILTLKGRMPGCG